MNDFNIKTALEWLGAIVVAVGGAGVIIIGLAKWFGDFIANKLLEKDKAKYSEELEALKNKYQQELETRKSDLEKSKALFLRYSEHQFSLYNDVWKNLCDLKDIGEELWEKAEPQKLKEFSKQLSTTKLSVEKSALLIEDDHFQELTKILDTFGSFEIGKLRLINLRNKQVHELEQFGVNDYSIRDIIDNNGQIKNQFQELLVRLSKSFKRQIKGE